jgi:membrane-bound lytic murein transglycosylase D
MAAAIIAKHPDQYGFEEVPADVHQFEEIVVSRPFALRAIAAATEIPYAELHRLNPELRRDVTPPDDPAYHLKVPVGSRATVEQALATIKPWTPPVVTARFKRESGRHFGQYRVRMGDNLGKIAKRFRLTVEELKARNKLSGRSIKVGDVLVVGR